MRTVGNTAKLVPIVLPFFPPQPRALRPEASFLPINPLENEAVVRSFEATEGYRSLGFAPDALEAAWGPATARLLGLGAGQHDMTLFPHRHGTDGFFVCRWRRAPAAPASPTARSPPANPC
ncbi:hypothetical protein DIPPA_32752 [Diplonema papillatum]|nr:hypothetical protein DIPPA_32752 [Diplonema papillatum]